MPSSQGNVTIYRDVKRSSNSLCVLNMKCGGPWLLKHVCPYMHKSALSTLLLHAKVGMLEEGLVCLHLLFLKGPSEIFGTTSLGKKQ